MAERDRVHWDSEYAGRGPAAGPVVAPEVFATHQDVFPTAGHALDLACGAGLGSVWLARRGLKVWGLDVSPVAIEQAQELAQRNGVGDRCRFSVIDLDDGLPDGPQVDVILCHRFRDARLDRGVVARLVPGGLLAITALSEVGAQPGPFRAAPGELLTAFADLDHIIGGEGDGRTWLLARRRL